MKLFIVTLVFLFFSSCAHMTDTQKEQATQFILDSASRTVDIACDIAEKRCTETE